MKNKTYSIIRSIRKEMPKPEKVIKSKKDKNAYKRWRWNPSMEVE